MSSALSPVSQIVTCGTKERLLVSTMVSTPTKAVLDRSVRLIRVTRLTRYTILHRSTNKHIQAGEKWVVCNDSDVAITCFIYLVALKYKAPAALGIASSNLKFNPLLNSTLHLALYLWFAYSITMASRMALPVYHYLDIGRLGRGEVVK